MGLRDELQAIYEHHGKLTPALVVETARPKTHPLHAAVFHCSPKEAAEAYYHLRARDLIRSVRIVKEPETSSEDERVAVRQWVSIQEEDGFAYRPADEVAADPFLTELTLRTMEREWRQMKERYGRFHEFVQMVRRDIEAA